jgi:hypothetical protein
MSCGRCRLHGGRSTGPRTADGRERSRRANLRHGFRTGAAIAERKRMVAWCRQVRTSCGLFDAALRMLDRELRGEATREEAAQLAALMPAVVVALERMAGTLPAGDGIGHVVPMSTASALRRHAPRQGTEEAGDSCATDNGQRDTRAAGIRAGILVIHRVEAPRDAGRDARGTADRPAFTFHANAVSTRARAGRARDVLSLADFVARRAGETLVPLLLARGPPRRYLSSQMSSKRQPL